jgi:hypothetical protein
MAYGTTNISLNAVAATLSETTKSVLTVCQSANQNRWAFYRGARIRANATTRLVELVNVAPYKLGDFRRYEHTQTAPLPVSGGTVQWGPTNPSTVQFDSAILINKLNIKEIADYHNTAYDYYVVDAYDSTSDRTNETDRKYRWIIPITFETANPAIPVDHTLDDLGITQQPKGTQNVSLTGISTSYSTLYLTTSIGNAGGTIGIRLDSPYSTLTIQQIFYPTLGGGVVSPSGTGHVVRNRNDSAVCSGNEVNNLSAGTQTLSGYCTPYNESSGKRMTTTGNVDLWLVKDGVDYIKVSSGSFTSQYRFWSQASVPVANGETWTVDLRKTSGSWSEVTC